MKTDWLDCEDVTLDWVFVGLTGQKIRFLMLRLICVLSKERPNGKYVIKAMVYCVKCLLCLMSLVYVWMKKCHEEAILLKWIFTVISKTCLYNTDRLKPHFYIVKLGFTGVYIIFLVSAQNIDCRYSLEPPHRGGSNEYPQSMFWAETWKISEFFIRKFSFFGSKIFSIFE